MLTKTKLETLGHVTRPKVRSPVFMHLAHMTEWFDALHFIQCQGKSIVFCPWQIGKDSPKWRPS